MQTKGIRNQTQKSFRKCQIYLTFYYAFKVASQLVMFVSMYGVGMTLEPPVTTFKKSIIFGKHRIYHTLNYEQMRNYTLFAETIPWTNFATNDIFVGVLESWLRICVYLTHCCIEMWYMGALPIVMWLSAKMFMEYVQCQENRKDCVEKE